MQVWEGRGRGDRNENGFATFHARGILAASGVVVIVVVNSEGTNCAKSSVRYSPTVRKSLAWVRPRTK